MDCFLRRPISLHCVVLLWLSVMVSSSPNTKAILVGTDLVLTCNHTNSSQWWFDGKSLHSNTQEKNGRLTLEVKNVSIHNNGNYWCGRVWERGYNVYVIIGNLPSKPRSVHSSSYDWNDTLYWKASFNTGGLPVNYIVKAKCPKFSPSANLNCQDSPVHIMCKNKSHVHNKEYNCSLKMDLDKNQLDLYTNYSVCVFAINQLGNASSCINYARSCLTGPMTTPAPPPNLRVLEQGPGNARLSWSEQEKLDEFNFVYITIKRSGDDHNTTHQKVPSKYRAVVIPNLKAHSLYTFYVRSRYEVNGSKPSVLSSVKTVTLQTRDTVPDQPPQNLTCSWNGTFSNGKGDIFLLWKLPPKESLNGKLTHFIVLWRVGDQSFSKTINGSQTSIFLRGFSQHDGVTLNIRACNEKSCSGITSDCHVNASPDKKLQQPSNLKIIIIGTIIGILILVITAASIIWYKRSKGQGTGVSWVDEMPTGPQLSPRYTRSDYNSIEDISSIPCDEYTRVNNSIDPLIEAVQ